MEGYQSISLFLLVLLLSTVLGRQVGKTTRTEDMAEDDAIMDVAEEETPAVEEQEIEINEETALRGVLRKALVHDGLQRGLHE